MNATDPSIIYSLVNSQIPSQQAMTPESINKMMNYIGKPSYNEGQIIPNTSALPDANNAVTGPMISTEPPQDEVFNQLLRMRAINNLRNQLGGIGI